MTRFCAYVDKVFHFGSLLETLHEPRCTPLIPIGSIFSSAFAMFATARCSLHSMEKDLVRILARLRGVVGPQAPSSDTIGRVFAIMDPEPLRQMLRSVHHRLRRNKALLDGGERKIAAVDGHEFFSQSRALLSGVLDPHDQDQRGRGHRVLSPRRDLPSRGA
jgi:hypothetical protein